MSYTYMFNNGIIMLFCHSCGVTFASDCFNNSFTFENLNVVLLAATSFFMNAHTSSIGFNSQWYGGKRRTVFFGSHFIHSIPLGVGGLM